MAAKYADELIVLSEGNRKYFKDMYGRNATLIPNGVEKPELKEAKLILERYGLKKKSYILFLARIVPEKGLHYLIEAFKDIATDKKLCIVGGTSHSGEYVEQVRWQRMIQESCFWDSSRVQPLKNCSVMLISSTAQ